MIEERESNTILVVDMSDGVSVRLTQELHSVAQLAPSIVYRLVARDAYGSVFYVVEVKLFRAALTELFAFVANEYASASFSVDDEDEDCMQRFADAHTSAASAIASH